MSTTINMPQLGETVTEGTILRWAKQVGQTIAEDEVLVEISTDKVDTEVPSPAAGTLLEILVPEGETVAVGTPLVVIGEASEATATEADPAEAPHTEPTVAETQASPVQESVPPPPPPPPPEETPPTPQPPPPPPPTPTETAPPPPPQPSPSSQTAPVGRHDSAGLLLSPVVRKLIREHQLDVNQIPGTGLGGRVTRRDVEGAISAGMARITQAPSQPVVSAEQSPPPVVSQTPQPPPPTVTTPPEPTPPPPTAPPESPDQEITLDRIRVRIGENMIRSKQTAAHVWTSMEVDFERVERVRQAHRATFKTEEGFSLTYLPFIARATIDALKAFPVVNSSFYLEERKAVFHRSVHLGIAVDLNQEGLVVTTIPNADGLRLVGLARRIRDLAQRARAGKLTPDDVTGATFSITNPGPYGSLMSAPIINVPNVGILSTDTIAKRPAVVTTPEGQDTLAIRHIGYLGLSWDHRAFDGSTAVLFVKRIKDNLETWDWEQELS